MYRNNSLVRIDERRNKPSYNTFIAATPSPQSHEVRIETKRSVTAASKTSKLKPNTADPFRVRNCLLDVDLQDKEVRQTPKPVVVTNQRSDPSVRKRLKKSSTAVVTRTGGSADYQSLLPGNCTSYYSIRKYYEQEKDKLLHKHSPEQRRQRTVQWILNSVKLPQSSVVRRTTTSAIFRDFSKSKGSSDISSPEELSKLVTLPDIDKDSSLPIPNENSIMRSQSDIN